MSAEIHSGTGHCWIETETTYNVSSLIGNLVAGICGISEILYVIGETANVIDPTTNQMDLGDPCTGFTFICNGAG